MRFTNDQCYAIIQAKDPRFDGVFYTAVKTTGIYCRPICKVLPPRKENCTFYDSSYLAEQAGYRPCLRCRPELAPAYSEFQQTDVLLSLLVDYFNEENYSKGLIQRSAQHFGITPRHIHRLFINHLGVSPSEYIMTKRLLHAKRLLRDTTYSIGNIAEAVGFPSTARLTEAIKKHYGLPPTKFRSLSRNKEDTSVSAVTTRLSYRPPYDWDTMLSFLKQRAIPGVEWVDDTGIYRRTLQITHHQTCYKGWIEVTPKPSANYVELSISPDLEPVLLRIITLVRKVFDLDAFPWAMPEGIAHDIRLPGCFDPFEMSVRAILGQQISVKAATTLTGRLVSHMGMPTITPWPQLHSFFPKPALFMAHSSTSESEPIPPASLASNSTTLEDILGPLGIIRTRSRTILSLATLYHHGHLQYKTTMDIDLFIQSLMTVKGIGHWTANYIAMRALSWPDIFLETDLIIRKKLTLYPDLDPSTFAPWRSYLTLALWQDKLDGCFL